MLAAMLKTDRVLSEGSQHAALEKGELAAAAQGLQEPSAGLLGSQQKGSV